MEPDTRNVIDYYKYWTNEAIKADLDSKRHPFSVLISNKFQDFNIGSVVRASNAFLATTVFIYGRGKWDKRGAVGTQVYQNIKKIKHIETVKEAIEALGDVHVVGVDNIDGALPVEDFEWTPPPTHTLMIFGQEDVGVPDELLEVCHDVVYIKQYGSVRSLNVGVASGIIMYDYVNKLYRTNGPDA